MSQSSPTSELTLAEQARTLVHAGRFGTLATSSRKVPGYPFPSLVAFADDRDGSPLLLLSQLAVHTQNLAHEPRAALSIVPHSEEPLASARLSLMGMIQEVDSHELEALRQIYLTVHPEAEQWLSFADFTLRRLHVEHAYLVAGFGRMGWIDSSEYVAAAPDPLADHATAIIEHMNSDHADALPLYCRAFAGLEARTASMLSVDSRGMLLQALTDDGPKVIRVPLPRAVTTPDELRKLLIEMLQIARSQPQLPRSR